MRWRFAVGGGLAPPRPAAPRSAVMTAASPRRAVVALGAVIVLGVVLRLVWPGGFWPFWVSYPLGYNVFRSFGGDAWRFLAWPSVDGVSLYLMLIAFALLTAAALAIYAEAFALAIWPRRRRAGRPLGGRATDTGLALRGSFWGYGLLFTLSGFVFYRHYLIVAFALPFVSLAVCALLAPGRGRRLLTVLVIAEAAISVGSLTYIHVRGGAPGGDYGVAYDHQAPTPGR